VVRRTLRRPRGFTLVELLVVLAILALLLTIVSPRYIHHVDRARETTLRSQLRVMREAIDKFEGDQGRLPPSLQELVDRNYLKSIPLDPVTDRSDTWITLNPEELDADRKLHRSEKYSSDPASTTDPVPNPAPPVTGDERLRSATAVADVRSGAPGNGADGTAFRDW